MRNPLRSHSGLSQRLLYAQTASLQLCSLRPLGRRLGLLGGLRQVWSSSRVVSVRVGASVRVHFHLLIANDPQGHCISPFEFGGPSPAAKEEARFRFTYKLVLFAPAQNPPAPYRLLIFP